MSEKTKLQERKAASWDAIMSVVEQYGNGRTNVSERDIAMSDAYLNVHRDLTAQLATVTAERDEARRERDELREIVRHCWIHSSYKQCGYYQMTNEQKGLFDSVLSAGLAASLNTEGKQG